MKRCMLLMAGTAGLLFGGCSKQEEPAPLIRPVRTMRVSETAELVGRIFPGRAEAVLAVDIAFEVPGQLIERSIQVGDQVKKGQVLAKLDPRDYANALESSKARLTQAEAFYERIERAAKSGAVSQQDLTDALAQLEVAQSDLKIKQKALDDTAIVAQFGGTISAIYVENFENVRAKQSIVRLMDISEIEMRVDVPEKLIMLVDGIEDLQVIFDPYPDQPVPATIKEIGREASSATRTFPVTLAIDQPEGFKILPGMTGQASGKGRASTLGEGVTQIPVEAIFEKAGERFVWIVDESSMRVQPKEVEPHEANQRGMLVQGLEKGTIVVTAGAHSLSEGQVIRLLEEE